MAVLSAPNERAFGSWLLGGVDQSVQGAMRRAHWLITLSVVAANIAGAVGVFVLIVFALPTPVLDDDDHLTVVNLVAASIYFCVTALLSTVWGHRSSNRRVRWMLEGRAPTPKEQRATLRIPVLMLRINLVFWWVAALGFGGFNAFVSVGLGVSITVATALGGILTAANAYFLSEFALRPVSARALAAGPPARLFMPGLRTRTLVAWVLGSAIPVAALIALGIENLAGGVFSRDRFSLSVICLGAVVLLFGSFLIRLSTRATADPIGGLRDALARVAAGDLDTEVPIYDATQVGLLQVGFNQMVAGLQERERIRELFGRQVGEEAASVALESGVELGGELREVSVLFVDIVGSTTLAATRPPHEVVDLLNRFFAVVVEVVDEHGGWINKFQGDATLAVFGAPTEHPDAAGSSLAAARALRALLSTRVPECDIGIGVAAGPAVVGHVGTATRYEYTVVGDCVNEAARLSAVAKDLAGRLAASAEVVARASADGWVADEEVLLRGRSAPTQVMVYSEHGASVRGAADPPAR